MRRPLAGRRVVQHSIAREAATHRSTYRYDAAGRLVSAIIPEQPVNVVFPYWQ